MSVTARLSRLIARHGVAGSFRQAAKFVRYHLVDTRQFVYFEFLLDKPIPTFAAPPGCVAREATSADRSQVVHDVFPDLVGDLAHDRHYFETLGADEGVRCFLGEVNGRIVHYSWVILDARQSPVASLPIGPLREGDAYLGPVFTSPRARGLVYPFVLGIILHELRRLGRRRVLLMVDGRRPAAVGFYVRLGFAKTGRPPGGSRLPRWPPFRRQT